jgi:hypothetical protein
MMYGFDQALALETKALAINAATRDHVALELDYQLWRLLQDACRTHPDAACEIFGIHHSTAAVIAAAEKTKLQELSSGAVLSFGIQNTQQIKKLIEDALASQTELDSSVSAMESPELAYWRAVRLMALRDPHQAHAKTGVPADLLCKLAQAGDRQLANLAQCEIGFGLMCSEAVISDILLETKPETLTQLRLKKVQQCLTARGRAPSVHAPPSCSSMTATNRQLVGRLMLITGFVNRVVELETGLSYKQIIKLQAHIRADKVKINNPQSRSLKTGASLVYNYSSKIQASLLMQLYVNVGGADVYHNTNVNALLRAYHIYHQLREEIPGMKAPRWAPFDINSTWSLVAELRRSADAGMMGQCDTCNCSYFTSAAQRTYIECPYCHVHREKTMQERPSPTADAVPCSSPGGHAHGDSCPCMAKIQVKGSSAMIGAEKMELDTHPYSLQHPPPLVDTLQAQSA